MSAARYPSLYQLNTRVKHRALSWDSDQPFSLDDWPDSELDRLAKQGFDWLWLLGVWQTGQAGLCVSRTHPGWQQAFRDCLPDLSEQDVCGSCFAIVRYETAAELGGDAALRRLRGRLNQRGLSLMLDFVPNHTALDHPWRQTHPDFYLQANSDDLAREPQNYVALNSSEGERIFAYGRDPYFDGWPDTLQLDYGHPPLQRAMLAELLKIADRCDGIRCDMAMLLLPEVFQRTWGRTIEPFWPKAIQCVRERYPALLFLAEVYWELEWALQQQGFDFTYDKRLYDHLKEQAAQPVHEHLAASLEYQRKLARFLENHDEPRAATSFPGEVHQAAAIVTFLAPGLRFFHDGQLQGKRIHLSVHLCRSPDEPIDAKLADFYQRLLQILRQPLVRNGDWVLLDCFPAEQDNDTWHQFIIYQWRLTSTHTLLVVVNYAPQPGQCRLRLADTLDGKIQAWRDVMRSGKLSWIKQVSLNAYCFDLPRWGYLVLAIPVLTMAAKPAARDHWK